LDVSPHGIAESAGKAGTALARPVVSGIGTISAAGLQTTETMEKADCFKELTRFSTPYKPCIAGLVPPLDPRQVDRRLNLRGMDLCSQYVTLATRLALNNAELPMRPAVMVDTGMVLGLASGHTASESAHLEAVFESDFNIDRLGAFPYVVPNEVAGNAARSLMLKGHSTVLAGGKGAGLAALISAICAVEQGHTSRVIAASSDEITERELADRYSVGAWGPNTGIIPGEGAAALVIEEAKSVKQRGGRVQAEIFGYGVATDVEHPKRATGYALSRALFQALDRSGVKPDEIVAAACTLDGSDSSKLEQSILLKKLPRAEQFSLFSILGCAEATLPLLNLSKALISYPTDSLIACASLSDEGFARVVILRRV
jgi:3-oxoacyl-(acyl-carrier-protein) synthase